MVRHNEETYEMIDEYLESAFEVMTQMYQKYGEKLFTSSNFNEYFDEFRDDTYDHAETISDENLKMFAEHYFTQLNQALDGKVDSIELTKKRNAGQLKYDISIIDKTDSMTSLTLDNRGRNVHWGSSTPAFIKDIISNIMFAE